jgi:hypothetical protein
MKIIFKILIVALILNSNFSVAQSWKPIFNSAGGFINQIVCDPVDSNILYVVTKGAGCYKSLNNGEDWFSISNDIPKYSSNDLITRDLVIDPNNHNKLYSIAGVAPYTFPDSAKFRVSNDAGSTWSLLTNCPVSVGASSDGSWGGSIILINPSNSQQIIIGGQPNYDHDNNVWANTGGVWISNDGGNSWNIIDNSISKYWITGLKFKPGSVNEFYFSVIDVDNSSTYTEEKGFFNYNITSQILTQLSNFRVIDFDFDANNSNIILTTSNTGINISTDAGLTWSDDIYPNYNYYNFFVKAHPTESGHWFFGTYNWQYGSIMETLNYGASWREAQFYDNPNRQKLSYNNTNQYKPIMGDYPSALVFSPHNNYTAYLCDEHGFWKTSDANKVLCISDEEFNSANWKWKFSSNGISNVEGRRICNNKLGTKIFLCSTNPALIASDGWNSSVVDLPDPDCDQISVVRFSNTNQNIVYAGGSVNYNDDGKLFKSVDGGLTWNQMAYNYFDQDSNDIENVTQLVISPFSSDTIIACVDPRNNQLPIHISFDGGNSWQSWSENVPSNDLFPIWNRTDLLFTDNNGNYFFYYNNKLFRRNLSESQWNEIDGPHPGWWFANVIADENIPGTIYCTHYGNDIFKSNDSGNTWTEFQTESDCNTSLSISSSGSAAVLQCDDESLDRSQKIFFSLSGDSNFIEIPTNGIVGVINNLKFIGPYTLSAWSENSGGFILDLNTVGINSLSLNSKKISIYPNPATTNDEISIIYNSNLCSINVYDLSGKLVFHHSNIGTHFYPKLLQGAYIIEIDVNGEIQKQKLFII